MKDNAEFDATTEEQELIDQLTKVAEENDDKVLTAGMEFFFNTEWWQESEVYQYVIVPTVDYKPACSLGKGKSRVLLQYRTTLANSVRKTLSADPFDSDGEVIDVDRATLTTQYRVEQFVLTKQDFRTREKSDPNDTERGVGAINVFWKHDRVAPKSTMDMSGQELLNMAGVTFKIL